MVTAPQAILTSTDGNILYSCGDHRAPIWLHSVGKPVALVPFLQRGLDRKYGLTPPELVLLASSHLGQPQHMEAIDLLLQKTGIKEDALCLPPSAPQGQLARANWTLRGGRLEKRFHPCIGAHIALMLLHREHTGQVSGYSSPNSPAQKEILSLLKEYTGLTPVTGMDRCGIPMYGYPLPQIAELYQNLASESDPYTRFLDALHAYPVLIEGDGCIPSMLCSRTTFLAKTGINHLLAVGLKWEGLGLAIRGPDWCSVRDILVSLLRQIRFQDLALIEELQEMQMYPG